MMCLEKKNKTKGEKYLSESWPEIRDPKRYPTKRVEDAKGTFHWLSHTRSHCEGDRNMIRVSNKRLKY